MTLRIVKGQPGKSDPDVLTLIDSTRRARSERATLHPHVSRWAASALMARLMTPRESSSIVGLLGAVRAESNVDEVSQWVESQTDLAELSDARLLSMLELRLKRQVGRYPEP